MLASYTGIQKIYSRIMQIARRVLFENKVDLTFDGKQAHIQLVKKHMSCSAIELICFLQALV